jgi:hypothetical protein
MKAALMGLLETIPFSSPGVNAWATQSHSKWGIRVPHLNLTAKPEQSPAYFIILLQPL